MRCDLESAGATHMGRRRRNNQDNLLRDESLGPFIVADGRGGRSSGEVASKMAVEIIGSAGNNIDGAVNTLIEAANDGGGRDNSGFDPLSGN